MDPLQAIPDEIPSSTLSAALDLAVNATTSLGSMATNMVNDSIETVASSSVTQSLMAHLFGTAQAVWALLMTVPYAEQALSAGQDVVWWLASFLTPLVSIVLPHAHNVTQTLADFSKSHTFYAVTNGIKMLVAATIVLYMAAHGSLQRPPSAKVPKNKQGGQRAQVDDYKSPLGAWDAIMMPVIASITLVGLHYLLQWLDPAWINTILRYYMSFAGVINVAVFGGHVFGVLSTFVFPTFSRDRKGMLWQAVNRSTTSSDHSGAKQGWKPVWETRYQDERVEPGSAVWWRSVGIAGSQRLWGLRRYILGESTIEYALKGMPAPDVVAFRFTNVAGILAAMILCVAYTFTHATWLSNIMSVGMCYGTLMLLTPTRFSVCSLILGAFFVYDIVMVFYTPYMISVATKLDAPIKLSFESPVGINILGLGDILLPGLFICLALRFDLHLHWAAKIRTEPVTLKTESVDKHTGEVTTSYAEQTRAIKATYMPPSGLWGDRVLETLWRLFAWFGYNDAKSPFLESTPSPRMQATMFRKPYFWASMTGYSIGMVLTLGAMIFSGHGQPALLYLVPCVIASTGFLAWYRSELRLWWAYTEDGSLDDEDVIVDVDADGHRILHSPPKNAVDASKDDKNDKDAEKPSTDESSPAPETDDKENRTLFQVKILGPEDELSAEVQHNDDNHVDNSRAENNRVHAEQQPENQTARDTKPDEARAASPADSKASSEWSLSEGELSDPSAA